MTWFRLDDAAAFDAKVLAAGNEAFGAWCRAGCWASGKLTDGFIPDEVAPLFGSLKVWRRLEEARAGHEHGLVERRPGGWQIHDFLDWNPSAAETRAKRETRAAAGRLGGIRSGEKRSKHEAIASPVASPESNPRPVPSRPDPKSDPPLVPPAGGNPEDGEHEELAGQGQGGHRAGARAKTSGPPSQIPLLGADSGQGPKGAPKMAPAEKPQKRRATMDHRPASWAPNEGHYTTGGELGLGREQVLAQVPRWADYHLAKGTLIADFDASFRTWLGNVNRFVAPGGKPSPSLQQPAKPGEFQWKRA